MTFAQHLRAVTVLGLPLIGSHLAQFAIHVIDTIMLGWYDITALAASVLATSFYFVIFIMGSGFAFAVMGMVAEGAGADDNIRIRRVTRMGMWLSVAYAVIFLPAMIWSEPILLAFGQEPELAALAQDYLRIVSLGLFPALLVMVLKSYLAALEHTGIVLWATVSAALVNAVLNWILIFGNLGAPEMGLAGAAWASVGASSASLLVLVVYIDRKLPLHEMFARVWRPDRPALGEVFRIGWPIGLTNLAESGMFSASALLIGLIGELPLAAHGIALQIASATFMVHLGLSQAATVRAGRALGRKDIPALGQGGIAAVTLSMGFVAITVILFLGVPSLLISGFISPDEPQRVEILAIGTGLLAVAALFQLVDAGQVIALGMLRGIQDTKIPMYLAALSYWVCGIPASWLIGIYWGGGAVGVWLGLCVGLLLATILLWRRFLNTFKGMQSSGGAAAPS